MSVTRIITRIVASLAIAAMLTLIIGCRQSRATKVSSSAPTVSLAEFAGGGSAERVVRSEPGEDEIEDEVPVSDPIPAGSDLLLSGDEPVVVDSLVGQVNGRPIFADEFFEPIEDQLRAEGEGLQEREFILLASNIIGTHLRDVVLNELMLAQAESGLSEQQQMGLIYWLGEVRNEVTRQFGGSAARADEALTQREGQSFDEYVEELRERTLIEQLLQDKISPRVIVSWRDVENEYDRRFDEFNPPAIVNLSRIRLRKSEAERIELVKLKLAAGADFSEIADEAGMREAGAWREFTVGDGGLSDIEGLTEPVQVALAGLGVGDTTAPIDVATSLWWLHVASIDQEPARTIYDVQRLLVSDLQARRGMEEQNRYLATLFAEGIFDELDVMRRRLLAIAVTRYWS